MWIKIGGELISLSGVREIKRTEDNAVRLVYPGESVSICNFTTAEAAQDFIDNLYKKLTFGSWVTDTKGALRNLKTAHKIEVGTSAGKSKVYATFALSNKTNDPAFYEMATLATFDNETDAIKYRDELKELLNK